MKDEWKNGKDPIRIKKSHKGRLTRKASKAGMSVQEFAAHVLKNKGKYDHATIMQSVFAHNEKGWDKK